MHKTIQQTRMLMLAMEQADKERNMLYFWSNKKHACNTISGYVGILNAVCLPSLQSIFHVCINTHIQIKASCNKGDDIQCITHVTYRSTDILSPCHMTAKKSRLKIYLVPACLKSIYNLAEMVRLVGGTFNIIHFCVGLLIVFIFVWDF